MSKWMSELWYMLEHNEILLYSNVTSQKTVLFMVTIVRTSNLTQYKLCRKTMHWRLRLPTMLPAIQIHILNLSVEAGLLCILLQELNINYGIVKQTYGLCVTDAHKASPIVLWGIPLLKLECLPHWAADKPFHNNAASSPHCNLIPGGTLQWSTFNERRAQAEWGILVRPLFLQEAALSCNC
jgi:hypothetical protein